MNKQALKTSVVALAGFSLAFSVFAQSLTPSVSPSPKPTPMGSRVQDLREETNAEIRDLRNLTKAQIEQLQADFKAKLTELRNDLKSKIEAKRLELQNRLRNIKNERKQQTVLRIDNKIDELNDQMTKHYSSALDQIEGVLAKIKERADKDEEKGVDVSSVRTALDAANKAIADVRAAIVVQAGKTYKIEVTTEPRLKTDVGKVRQALHTDLKALEDKVKAARDLAHEAARALAKAHGRDLPVPSPTPSVSPSVTPTPTSTSTP